jgi:hypothetical protein
MHAALKLARSRDQHIGRNPGAPQHLVGEAASAALRRCVIRHYHQDVVIAVGACVSPDDGTEQVNALRMVGIH